MAGRSISLLVRETLYAQENPIRVCDLVAKLVELGVVTTHGEGLNHCVRTRLQKLRKYNFATSPAPGLWERGSRRLNQTYNPAPT